MKWNGITISVVPFYEWKQFFFHAGISFFRWLGFSMTSELREKSVWAAEFMRILLKSHHH